MKYENEITCNEFEEYLSDYLDKSLADTLHKGIAEHALSCPLCHSLLNEVKDALSVCHEIAMPKPALTRLEARILSATFPEMTMVCLEFENYLTDYLDGFLPASLFHRWERHAVMCENCTDLPGEVVRSIATCYTYKADELLVPKGLHEKIFYSTIGRENAREIKPSLVAQIGEWVRSWSFPISIPQLAPVAMMLIVAFFVFTQSVSADGSIGGMYQKSFELAQQTYQQGTGILVNQPISVDEEQVNEGN